MIDTPGNTIILMKRHCLMCLLLVMMAIPANAQYTMKIKYVDKDSSFQALTLHLTTTFTDKIQCSAYIGQLPQTLRTKGYLGASVDRVTYFDNFAELEIYLGKQQTWLMLKTDSIENVALESIGFNSKNYKNKIVNIENIDRLKEQLLGFYEMNGFPFATVYLDNIELKEDSLSASLKVNKGPVYHIDSIRINGRVNISNYFIQRHLGILNGSLYNREKLEKADLRIKELTFLEPAAPASLQMLGTGSVLNLYLKSKKSSQINFLIGVLPANNESNQLRLTGDVNLNLKSSLGHAETILLNWQQLQAKSPRLQLGYQQPYLFNSPFGIDASFSLFKKDSSFIQINAQLGIQYEFSANRTGKLYVQRSGTTILGSGIDTNQVKTTHTLPPNIDVGSTNFGLEYESIKTNYRLNPRTGNEVFFNGSIGIKKISKNSDIVNIKDTGFNYAGLYDSIKLNTYQFKIKATFSHYIPVGKSGTCKLSLNTGIFSSESVFRNELFQLGGYKLMRGFDEESIYATKYGIGTIEYRILTGTNSYFFGFVDGGWVNTKYLQVNLNNTLKSAGMGLLFETKFGLLNLSLAVGKRDDVPFNLRQSTKIHFGYINYF